MKSGAASLSAYFLHAIQDWIDALGADYVVTDSTSRQTAQTATFSTESKIPAILRPADREQVQACLRIAQRHQVPIYPISSGKNWGYGSRVPASDNCVLLDLGRLDRILDYDADLGTLTIEPGVTQQQVYDFLQAHGARFWMDATGASPSCSIIGNTMERGFGHTPYGDHFANACAFEVVLPTGELLQTGFARLPHAKSAHIFRTGFGPAVDGLFTQSNLGVVTRMTLWLMPAPEYFEGFFFQCEDDAQLEGLFEALRPLRLNGTLRSAIHIANDYRVMTSIEQYPWEETAGQTPLTPKMMERIRKSRKFGAWSGSGALYGTKAQVREARRLLKKALRGKVTRLNFLNQRLFNFARRFAGFFGFLTGLDLRKTLEVAAPVFGLMQGIPTDRPVQGAYWRKRIEVPADMDPDRDRCGLLWTGPVIPTKGQNAREIATLASEILLRAGFEPAITMTLLTERATDCIVSIIYDREIPGEDIRALACYHTLQKSLEERGYYPYRLGIQSMTKMVRDTTAYADMLSGLKAQLDPAGVLAPGRYQPGTVGKVLIPNEKKLVPSPRLAN